MKRKSLLSKEKLNGKRSLPFKVVMPRLYQVVCRWQPPKELQRELGTHWRKILVVVEDAGDYKTAAWEAGKFIIRERMGQAQAIVVLVDQEVHVLMNDVINCWIHHEGMMTVDCNIAFWADLE